MATLSEITLSGIDILVTQTTSVPINLVRKGLSSGIVVLTYPQARYIVNDLVVYDAAADGKQVLIDSSYCSVIKETDIEFKYTPTVEV